MSTVLVPLAEGFEEIEAVTIIDVLRRAGLEVTTAALGARVVQGAHAISITADTTLDELDELDARFDAIALPGGMPGSSTLRDDPRLRERLQKAHGEGRVLAAVCAAPIALEAAGVLDGKEATCYPSFQDQIPSAAYSDAAVVEDGNILTSRGPGTAMAFAIALARRLAGPEVAAKLSAGMIIS